MPERKVDWVRLSKFLAVMLRHEAEKFDLTLDAEGFTSIDAVWKQIHKRYPGQYTDADLQKVVEGDTDGKKRYEIRDGRIRALYGHSDVTDITYPPAEPPPILYHGTTTRALESIRKTGLQAQARQYVHLANDLGRARKTAARHQGKPIILRVRALEAHQAGVVFHNPEPEHFLARSIPPEFIDFDA